MPNYNLTGQKIKDTYSQLAQVSASTLVNGLGVAAPITTASITNFPTEVSRSAAAAGFGQGTGGVSEATFTAYTSSNNAIVTALTTRVNTMESATGSYAVKTAISGAFTSLSSSLSTRLTNDETSISSLNSATSSYALKTAISGAFTLPSGVVSSSAQINLAQAQGTASWASNAITASYALNSSTSAGLINGSGLNSLASSPSLTSTPATASGNDSIALGREARGFRTGSIAIGWGANAGIPFASETTNNLSVAVGYNATARGANAVAIGNTAKSGRDGGVAIGDGAGSAGQIDGIVAIGDNATSNDGYATGLGANSVAGYQATAVGYGASSTGGYGVTLGASAQAAANYTTAVGFQAYAGSENSTAIGKGASASATGAVALGYGTTANVVDYTTTKYLQLTNVSSSMGQYGYANDSAAGTAGVPLGGVYHTSGSLKIRMV